jgi:hypothetical protein
MASVFTRVNGYAMVDGLIDPSCLSALAAEGDRRLTTVDARLAARRLATID